MNLILFNDVSSSDHPSEQISIMVFNQILEPAHFFLFFFMNLREWIHFQLLILPLSGPKGACTHTWFQRKDRASTPTISRPYPPIRVPSRRLRPLLSLSFYSISFEAARGAPPNHSKSKSPFGLSFFSASNQIE